jgi:4a-hydroxytetrahydrobiopterin dehydratase
MHDLASKRCVPCAGGVMPMSRNEAEVLIAQLQGWDLADDRRIHKTYKFRDFRAAMAFINRMADVAEAEGHHPDFCVHYRLVNVTIWTHAVSGLTENDFILAAKIDQVKEDPVAN